MMLHDLMYIMYITKNVIISSLHSHSFFLTNLNYSESYNVIAS